MEQIHDTQKPIRKTQPDLNQDFWLPAVKSHQLSCRNAKQELHTVPGTMITEQELTQKVFSQLSYTWWKNDKNTKFRGSN